MSFNKIHISILYVYNSKRYYSIKYELKEEINIKVGIKIKCITNIKLIKYLKC